MTDVSDQSRSTPAPDDAPTLGDIGHRRQMRLAGINFSGRRRRPSGEAPPLPRQLKRSGWFWLIAGVGLVALWLSLFAFPATTTWWTDVDHQILNQLVDLRTDPVTTMMKWIQLLGSFWVIRPLRWATLIALAVYRRWRVMFGALAAFVLVDSMQRALSYEIGRPRPFVEILGTWEGYAHPSRPVALLAVTVVVVGLTLIPKGRWRTRWLAGTAVVVGFLGVALLYLGTDHPSDVAVGWLIGPVVGVLALRWIAPESLYPVHYGNRRPAHLDVTGERGEAIRAALQDQLGLTVVDIEPFGLEASGGSTPLRITCQADPPIHVFAKLYAQSHLRSDRWYKVARTIMVGSLEDEVRFTSVRRLAEYEDYILLKLENARLPSPRSFGFAEITPEREYLVVTEFLENAQEMGDADVDERVIDEALFVVRRMWDAGIAHRDIKPANVMVAEGRVVLIDPSYATVRPSPWRQAVDLANMMIILALRDTPERVYEQALRYFSPDDVAEAFAATSSITIPSQSRSSLAARKKAEGLDIVERFRQLAPTRERISIQRWTLRRVALTLGAVLVAVIALSWVIDNFRTGVL